MASMYFDQAVVIAQTCVSKALYPTTSAMHPSQHYQIYIQCLPRNERGIRYNHASYHLLQTLQINKLKVFPPYPQELIVCALLNDLPLIKYVNYIGILYGA